MASNIDPTQPTAGNASTAAMRANMLAAKNEIEALQNALPRILSLRLTAQELLPANTDKTIPWDAVYQGDPTGIWSLADPTYLYVPAGYTSAEIKFSIEFAPSGDAQSTWFFGMTHKNAAAFIGNSAVSTLAPPDEVSQLNAVTARVPVIAGQKFSVMVNHRSLIDQHTVFGDYAITWVELRLYK